MRKMLLLSAALIAALTAPALAQRDNGRGDGPRAAQGQQDNRGGGFRGGDRGGSQRAPQATPQVQRQATPQPQPQVQAQRGSDNRNNGRDFNRGGNDNRGNFNRGGRDGRPDFNRGNDRRPDFNRGNDRRNYGRNDFGNRRYSQYYRNWNSTHRFRAGAYYRPPGFSYRRWSYGDILPSVFWGSRYWLNNYNAYDLPPPPPGTIWVRYGDDALLIDRYSGEVIQVSYSVFW